MNKYKKLILDLNAIISDPEPYLLTQEEQDEKAFCEESFYNFLRSAWPTMCGEYRDGWHIQAVCEHLESLFYGDIIDLVINIPFRCGKSLIAAVGFPAWVFLKDPRESFLYTSYSSRFAARDSTATNRLMESSWYQRKWGDTVKIRSRSSNILKFETTAGGYRMISSVNGSNTGGGANFIITDDPNNLKQVESEVIREKTNDWWDNVMSSRYHLLENRRRCIIQQRSHQLDLSGHILAKNDPNWIHLCLPMEYEAGRRCKTIDFPFTQGKVWRDPRKKEGELLWPEGLNIDDLIRLKESDFKNDQYVIAGQLQQRPSPLGGGILKGDWFQHWKEKDLPEFDYIVQSWDTALTSSKDSCYSACTTWGVFKGKGDIYNILLLSLFRERIEYPDLRQMATRLYNNYYDTYQEDEPLTYKCQADVVLIEAKVSGYSLHADLMRANLPVLKFDPKRHGDKIGRCRVVSHLMQNGLIWLPTEAPSYEHLTEDSQIFLGAAELFPNAESNDIIDSMSQAFIHLTSGGWVMNKEDILPPTREAWENEERPYW